MPAKKVAFGARPQAQQAPARTAEEWVETRTTEPDKRMTFDVPADLHRRVKAGCAMQGITIREKVLELLEREFPA